MGAGLREYSDDNGFERELYIPLRPVLVALPFFGWALYLLAILRPETRQLLSYPLFAALTYVLLACGWLLNRWRAQVGRWFAVLAWFVVALLMDVWLHMPGALALSAFAIVLSAALLGVQAAAFVAVGQSLLLVTLLLLRGEPQAIPIILAATWVAWGLMYLVYRPVRQIAQWSWEYYQRAMHLAEETRTRKAELEQALADLSHANRQLALANERMAALRAIAEEAQKSKTAFVANVSHEFRTPLNMIIGLVDLMVDSPEIYTVALSPAMREDLEVVRRNCEHLANMINDVLDLTRAEAGRHALHREWVSLQEIIDNSIAVVRPLLEKKRLTLGVTLPDDLPLVYCDRTRIQQVVLNLVSNAARFTEEGGITIEVTRQDQTLVVSVNDTGPGIAPEDRERIFEPFYQAPGDLQGRRGGSGLGLSISQQFVKLHGGRMWVESEVGVGTSFFFSLPIAPPPEHLVRPGRQIREDWVWRERAFRGSRAAATEELVKRRIIILDENGGVQREFERLADDTEIVAVVDVAQLEQVLQEAPAHVVIVNAGTIEGARTLMEMARRTAPGMPVIGCAVPQPLRRALEVGARGYLIKPVTRAKLQEALRSLGQPVRRVLVVDDDPEVLRLFDRLLHARDRNLEVVTVSGGEEALERLQRQPFDLVLLDVIMPGMDGWQVLEAMRRNGMGDIPTFFVSAQDPAEQPPVSELLMVTMNHGLPPHRVVQCALEIPALLLKPLQEPGPEPE